MKVLFIAVFPPVLLPEADHAFHIVRHLADEGLTVEVLTAKGSVKSEHPNVTQASVMEHWNWQEAARLAWVIRRSKPEAVFLYYVSHMYHLHPMVTYIPALVRKLVPQASMVTLFSNSGGADAGRLSRGGRLIHRLLRRVLGAGTDYYHGTMLRDSTHVITLSHRHLAELSAASPRLAEKSSLIPPPLIMPLSPHTPEVRAAGRRQLGVTDDLFLFAYFGYMYPGKGMETLLEAFQRVAAQQNSARLAIIGGVTPFAGGPEYTELIRQTVTALGLEEKIVFTGQFEWDSTQGSQYLRAANAAVLPFDGGVQMSNSSLAGVMTHGLPVITTAGPMTETLFVDGENVCFCPAKDPEAMAEAMLKVMADPALCQRLHCGSLAVADEWFSWKKATQRTLAALRSAN